MAFGYLTLKGNYTSCKTCSYVVLYAGVKGVSHKHSLMAFLVVSHFLFQNISKATMYLYATTEE